MNRNFTLSTLRFSVLFLLLLLQNNLCVLCFSWTSSKTIASSQTAYNFLSGVCWFKCCFLQQKGIYSILMFLFSSWRRCKQSSLDLTIVIDFLVGFEMLRFLSSSDIKTPLAQCPMPSKAILLLTNSIMSPFTTS